MSSSNQNTANLEKLIDKKSAALAIFRLKISGLVLANADPRKIDRLKQFEQAQSTYISYLKNELEQLRRILKVRKNQSAA